jgi:hypothetical protein
MKLYKFRSLKDIEYSLDILLNERLHCVPYDKLNDPFEGVFVVVTHLGGLANLGWGPARGYGTHIYKKPSSIQQYKIPGGTRICSLSATRKDVRLWSHYADGHKGIAIEIEFDEKNDELFKVDYVRQLKEFGNSLLTSPLDSTEILKVKSFHWEYEEEFRLILNDEFYSIKGKITGIYFGLRTPSLLQELIMRAVGNRIPIFSTELIENTIEVEVDKKLNQPQ